MDKSSPSDEEPLLSCAHTAAPRPHARTNRNRFPGSRGGGQAALPPPTLVASATNPASWVLGTPVWGPRATLLAPSATGHGLEPQGHGIFENTH